MRSEAVRTNWPTVAEKPARKALKGCVESVSALAGNFLGGLLDGEREVEEGVRDHRRALGRLSGG